jgi:hypothetical protein
MAIAEKDQVVEIRRSTLSPVHDVVRVGVLKPLAPGKAASTIPVSKDSTEVRGDGSPAPADTDGATVRFENEIHSRVAREASHGVGGQPVAPLRFRSCRADRGFFTGQHLKISVNHNGRQLTVLACSWCLHRQTEQRVGEPCLPWGDGVRIPWDPLGAARDRSLERCRLFPSEHSGEIEIGLLGVPPHLE